MTRWTFITIGAIFTANLSLAQETALSVTAPAAEWSAIFRERFGKLRASKRLLANCVRNHRAHLLH